VSVCLKCRVRGRVQGVAYRAATARKATELKVHGYARNLANGSVEVRVCGEPPQVEALRQWLWVGPSAAQVEGVECEVVDGDLAGGFRIE
jgi:acylphosphatase